MRVLVLGATGMLGNAVLRVFAVKGQHETWGTIRSDSMRRHFGEAVQSRLVSGVDVLNQDTLLETLEKTKPDVVINCVGLIKQLEAANDPLTVLPINALLPHRLSKLCAVAGARLIHVSTDCVFSGRKGQYVESDVSDAEDLYGKSKFIGEVHTEPHVITLRTSIIGHELDSNYALVDWFLSQQGKVKGYTNAVFSGLPTVELAQIMHDWVLPKPELHGLYHVSAKPIAKFDLLKMIAATYKKDIQIQPDDQLVIDRSLSSEYFKAASGYIAPEWPELIELMHRQR
jgi:dTDP-4-dehydrorhamnose reductase